MGLMFFSQNSGLFGVDQFTLIRTDSVQIWTRKGKTGIPVGIPLASVQTYLNSNSLYLVKMRPSCRHLKFSRKKKLLI